ncbi:cyclic nucleotide-binding protein, putative [Bodo saltans]|uniref:Cyclic nucleotide-binding protein, putative n=1 Tax=Bodo saltans TaxID=75058 RepID=A0A0S4J8W1_BODSA|nr:cyclic nucleotide-binding protein, putative [Bodo saltans]|eukprot:CUG86664.1 cyclic nucleotide-binding protein, putative [Bodo saltans]
MQKNRVPQRLTTKSPRRSAPHAPTHSQPLKHSAISHSAWQPPATSKKPNHPLTPASTIHTEEEDPDRVQFVVSPPNTSRNHDDDDFLVSVSVAPAVNQNNGGAWMPATGSYSLETEEGDDEENSLLSNNDNITTTTTRGASPVAHQPQPPAQSQPHHHHHLNRSSAMPSSSSALRSFISPPSRYNSAYRITTTIASAEQSPLIVTTLEGALPLPRSNSHSDDDEEEHNSNGIIELFEEEGDGGYGFGDRRSQQRSTTTYRATSSTADNGPEKLKHAQHRRDRNKARVVVLDTVEPNHHNHYHNNNEGVVSGAPQFATVNSIVSSHNSYNGSRGGPPPPPSGVPGGGARRSSFGNGSATTMESSMLLMSGGRSEHTSLPTLSIDSAKSVQDHRRRQQQQQLQRPPLAAQSLLLNGSGSGSGQHRRPHQTNSNSSHETSAAAAAVMSGVHFCLPTNGRGIFSQKNGSDDDDDDHRDFTDDDDDVAPRGPVNEWSMNASFSATSSAFVVMGDQHQLQQEGTSVRRTSRRRSQLEEDDDLSSFSALKSNACESQEKDTSLSYPLAAGQPHNSPSATAPPLARAVQRRAQERAEREQMLLKSRERQTNAVERKMFLAEHRFLQRGASWLTFVELARVMKRLVEVAKIAKRLREKRMRRGINPIVVVRLRQILRRVRTRIQGRGVPRPAIAALRADKLLNLFPDAQLQYAIDRMTLKYFFENENIIMMGSEDDEAYVLHSGVADVLMGQTKVFTMRGGMCFGSVGMISGEPRTASIVAREKEGCLAWVLTRAVFSAWGGGAEDKQKVAAAHAAINELRQLNMMNVYKKLLDPSTLGYFPMLSGVSHETLTSITTTSTRPRVERAGTVLAAPNVPLTETQPFLLLRGTVVVKVDQKSWAARANSYFPIPLHEQLRMLYDIPQRKRGGGGGVHAPVGFGDMSHIPKQVHLRKDFSGATIESILMPWIKKEQELLDAATPKASMQQQQQQQGWKATSSELDDAATTTTHSSGATPLLPAPTFPRTAISPRFHSSAGGGGFALPSAAAGGGDELPSMASLHSTTTGGNSAATVQRQQHSNITTSSPPSCVVLFEVQAPALFHFAPLFLAHSAAPPFTVEAATDCDLLGIGRENIRGQDVLELAVLRQNALNLHCDFIGIPTRAEFARILCCEEIQPPGALSQSSRDDVTKRHHHNNHHHPQQAPPTPPAQSSYFSATLTAVASKLSSASGGGPSSTGAASVSRRATTGSGASSPSRKMSTTGLASALMEVCPFETFVYGANDYMTFDPQSDLKVHIVLSGEIDPTSFRSGRTSVEVNGGPFVLGGRLWS